MEGKFLKITLTKDSTREVLYERLGSFGMNADALKKFNLTEEELSDLASRLAELLKKHGAFMALGFAFCISVAMGASTH